MRFPKVDAVGYAFAGGLDLVTSPMVMPPGRVIDAQNYEPVPVSGYRRIDGYERSDGRPSPTSANYWNIDATIAATITVGATLTGLTSGATGRVLQVNAGDIILGRVTGTFVTGESLQVLGVTKATATSAAMLNGSPSPSNHADYKLLAANDYRADIEAPPGSGSVRGVFTYNDITYALRDNALATAGDLFKQTAGGWVQVAFGTEIQFTGAIGQVNDGDLITGGTSGATAVVVRAMLRTGTWTVSGVGTLIISGVTGVFQSGEALQVGGVTKVTSSSLATAIARAPGGRLDYVIDNFTGAAATNRVYGADGVNLAFEFDGTNYIPIRTGMAVDTPSHVVVHRFYLMLSFQASHQISSLGMPYSWNPVTGAAEIATGSNITGYNIQTGNSSGAALGIFTDGKTFILYGASTSDFLLAPSKNAIGYAEYTIQSVGDDSYGLADRGIQALRTTLNYGDFQSTALSFLIQPLLERKRAAGIRPTASTTLGAKNQYRIYFDDDTGLVIGLTGGKPNGILPLNYGLKVNCISTELLSTGEEVTYFGSDDGFVYRDSTGTSFDGDVIEAWIRPAFNNLQSPRYRKQFRRAVFEVSCDGYSQVNATYDLNYASGDTEQAAPQQNQNLTGNGGYWDALNFYWDSFTWDSPIVGDAQISIDGTANNISFLFYSARAQDSAHVISAVNLLYTPRRLVHSGS